MQQHPPHLPRKRLSVSNTTPQILKGGILTFLLGSFLMGSPLLAQTPFSSKLPIIVINTQGQDIPDDPKIVARMGIVDNGPGQDNNSDDPFNHFDGFIGIEKRGSTSQDIFPKVGYGIETRDQFNEDLDVSLLGFPDEEDWVLHGPYSDKSLIRNALAYFLAGEIMDYAPRVRMTEVIINGEYQGVYLFTEQIKRDNDRVDISRLREEDNEGNEVTGGYILKFDKLTGETSDRPLFYESAYNGDTEEENTVRMLYHYPDPDDLTTPQRNYIDTWMGRFEDALASDDFLNPVTGYRQYVDLQSFVDFLLVNEVSRNVDGYRLSTYMYKEKDSEGGKLHMGPVWDFNLAFGNVTYCEGFSPEGWGYDFGEICPGDFWQLPFWWDKLREDPEFLELLNDRWKELRRGVLSDENLMATVDSFVNEMGAAADRNFDRWPVLGEEIWPNNFVGDTYAEEIDYMKGWIIARTSWMDGAISVLTPVTELAAPEMLRVFPNPSGGSFQLAGSAIESLRELRLYDAFGRQLATYPATGAGSVYSLERFPPGLYVLEGQMDNGQRISSRLVRR